MNSSVGSSHLETISLNDKFSTESTQHLEQADSKSRPQWVEWFSSLLGCRIKINQTNSQPGANIRQAIQANSANKFTIVPLSRFWSGTRIIIPKDSAVPSGSSNNSLTFQKTEQDAQDLLKQLSQLQGKGSLFLKHTKAGTELQYRNFWIQPSKQQTIQTVDYISSILSKAYPNQHAQDEETNEKQKTIDRLTQYISSSYLDRLNEDFIIALRGTLDPNSQPIQSLDLENNKEEQIPAGTTPIDFLIKNKHIEISTEKYIGIGGFGKVYAAKIGSEDYVYKMEKDAMVLGDDSEFNGKFWRHGDIAAARLQDLPHFAKSVGFILKVTKPGCQPQQWYVSTDMTKDFGKSLPEETKIELLSQLIKRAPGKELNTLLQDQSFKPFDHFNSITVQLFEFLEKAYARNLIHRDLKPSNCMYDPEKKELTIIDFGLGGVYGKREKLLTNSTATKTDSGNPLQSVLRVGTHGYLAPAVLNKRPYGSEVDFHSAGVMLLELIDFKAFNEALDRFFFDNTKIPTSVAEWLKIITPNSLLYNTLMDRNIHCRETIDLFFRVAHSEPDNIDKNFQNLKLRINAMKQYLDSKK